ncbi:MAG: aminodeoxychorismate/anthranilate synthase component II [Firmicutes bacterium]|nr:aminodeoxychorismate/anthranilate synthase component II [Alicyclobacillaceae bacterium]MCL6496419.1 aminodeoxychorismate/anthranilate synthase component II [Bacillota bacterium]
MILVIDNYDSFTYNLVQYLGILGAPPEVVRNDALTVEACRRLNPDAVVISPGPGRPETAGISVPLIQALGASTPILGVCLGHQAIAVAFGGRVVPAPRLMHGKADQVYHDGQGIFTGLPNPLWGGRYHSLAVDVAGVQALAVTATAADGTVMAIRHRRYPVVGVQFHPESILTPQGLDLLRNFLRWAQTVRKGG